MSAMQLNVVNEINTPKKILSLMFPPDSTFLGLKEKLIKDKLIAIDDPNTVQIWQSSLKLFPDDIQLNESSLIEGDTIILKLGPKVELDLNDKYIKMALDMGFSKPLVLGALANADGKIAQAMTTLMETAEQNDVEPDLVDDEFSDYEEYLKLAFDYLKRNHPGVFEQTLKDSELKRAFSNKIADLIDGFFDSAGELSGKEQEAVLENLVFKTCDNFVVEISIPAGYTVELGQADEEAIERIAAMGFAREQVIEAYLVANRDENA
eukprot:CAMPEP_0176470168 /NCGR_PEP_ID=MMETSP0127-20121128/40293_1 /TAXON_ID=938130 /ORGANISM="Platyophrya macrostoma, Strain WH" /LENGTH=264 /DNA_ID=CAMNT_0017864407 /DNA_START=36 /DNA_END=827 /DNA_ORIENTATION=+